MIYRMKKYGLLIILFSVCAGVANVRAQQLLNGQVLASISNNLSVEGIMVDAASGKTTFTDHLGYFQLPIIQGDTFYFYIGSKRSRPYFIDSIPDRNKFVVSLESILRPVGQATPFGYPQSDLADVTVYGRNYHKDSLANRQQYGKYFDYRKPTTGQVALGMLGSPVTALYEGLNKKKQRRLTIMKSNLLNIEQDGYIDSRFNLQTVIRYIGQQDETVLDDFMKKYRPKYEDLHTMGEVEFAIYINTSFKEYKAKYLNAKDKK